MMQDFTMKMAQKMMKITLINNYLKKQIFICIGLSFLLYLFYIRVLSKHLPKELNYNLNIIAKITFVYLFSIMIFLFITTIRKYCITYKYYQPREIKESLYIYSIIKKIIEKFFILYNKSLLAIHKIIMTYINYDYINKLTLYIITHIGFKHIYKFKLIFNFLPRILFLTIFIIEVLFFNRLDFLYKISFILLIPMLLQYFIFMLKDISIDGILELDNYIIIQHINKKDIISSYNYFKLYSRNLIRDNDTDLTEYKFSLTENYLNNNPKINEKATLIKFMQIYRDYMYLLTIIIHFESMDMDYLTKFNILYYFIYSSILGYILWLIF